MIQVRNALLPADISARRVAVAIDPIDCPAEYGPFETLNLSFRVTIRGPRRSTVPGDVQVTTRLVSLDGDGRERVMPYRNRWEDLEPGRHGRWAQLRATEVYRYELSATPQVSWDREQPGYDFARCDRIEVTIRASARDGTAVERTVVSRRRAHEEVKHD